MRRHGGLLVLTSAALLLGCGFPTEGEPSAVPEEEQPPSLITQPTGARPGLETVTLWFVENDALVAIDRRLPPPVDVAATVAVLAAGVSDLDSGLRSALPSAEMVVGAELSAGTASVELADDFLDIPSGDQVLALGQIVYTLTDLRGVGRVRFTIDDAPVVVPLPGGDSTEDSVSRDDFAALVAS